MLKINKLQEKLKLESLGVKRIEELNLIVGGDSGMGMDDSQGTCQCVKYSGCSVYIWSDGTIMATGGDWYED